LKTLPALTLRKIRERLSQLAIKETTHIETNDSAPLYIRRDSGEEYYAWHTRTDKSLQSFTGSMEGLMKVASELRRGIGQAKNKVKINSAGAQ